jgi:hypothetical protein
MLRGSSITPTDAPIGDGGQPNSVEGYSALESAARNKRISETLLQNLTAQDVFHFLVFKIPTLRDFEQVWSFSGADLISIDPKLFVRALQIEYPIYIVKWVPLVIRGSNKKIKFKKRTH